MKCSLIIPAYNEASRVGRVIKVARNSGLFSQVVVVDDASSDGTAEEAKLAGADVFSHVKNQGKARAMQTGLAQTSEPVVAFIDADLLNITVSHLELLVAPVTTGIQPAVLAVFKGGRLATSLAQKIAPMISGQRCLRRELLDGFDGWDSRFGIETALNDYLLRTGVKQHIVAWAGAAQIMKEEKRGFWAGLSARIRMFWEIFIAWLRSKRAR